MKKICILISFFIVSCTFGPNYERPKICMPSKYLENQSDKLKEKLSLNEWWKNFNDETLNEYIDIAIKNNYDLKIALEKINEARSLYNIKKADLFPEIDLNAKAIRERISNNLAASSFLGPTTQSFFQFGFDAIWEIDIFGRLRKSKDSAYFSYLSTIDDSLDVYITLLSDVAKTYLDIITFQRKIDLFEKKLIFQKKISNLTKEKFFSGLSNEIDEKEEYKIIQDIEKNLKTLTIYLKTSIHRLAILLGKIPEDLENNFQTLKKIPKIKKEIKVGLPSDLLRRRPDIRRAEKDLYAKTANIGVAIANLFPTFSLVGDFNYEASKSKNWFKWASRSWSIGPSMNLPIIDFGRRLSNIKVNKSIQKQAIDEYKNTVLLALEDTENALVAFFYEKDNLKFAKEKFLYQKKITILKNDLFLSGIENEINFLKSQNDLIDIKDEYLDKKRIVSTNLIALIKALGGDY